MSKRTLLVFMIVKLLFTCSIIAEENMVNNNYSPGCEEIKIDQSNKSLPYTPQVAFESQIVPVNYFDEIVFKHGLGALPLNIDILLYDANGNITGWNSGYKGYKGGWKGIKWDSTFCDKYICHVRFGERLSTAAYTSMKLVVWK